MKRLQKAAVISELADRLREHGSWSGETHLQKAAYFLQELLRVPLGYDFVLYRYGPFSFELRNELMEMRADGLLEQRPAPPYGPSLIPTEASAESRAKFPKTLSRHRRSIEFVASALGSKGVTDLEAIATALYVHEKEGIRSPEALQRRVIDVKPHLSKEQAESGATELLEILEGPIPTTKEG
jgi:uncharacterized protein YwgA